MTVLHGVFQKVSRRTNFRKCWLCQRWWCLRQPWRPWRTLGPFRSRRRGRWSRPSCFSYTPGWCNPCSNRCANKCRRTTTKVVRNLQISIYSLYRVPVIIVDFGDNHTKNDWDLLFLHFLSSSGHDIRILSVFFQQNWEPY